MLHSTKDHPSVVLSHPVFVLSRLSMLPLSGAVTILLDLVVLDEEGSESKVMEDRLFVHQMRVNCKVDLSLLGFYSLSK